MHNGNVSVFIYRLGHVSVYPCDISNDIMNNPDVVDLYISMMVASATSSRKAQIFNPFPPMFEKGSRDYAQCTAVLNLCPAVDDMRKHCSSEAALISFLHDADGQGRIYALLKWALSVSRAALLKMPPTLHIKEMNTPYQYMMTSGTDPERTANFKEGRKTYGSYFAFHGSGIENWHAILRVGLLNCSGTKLQTTGAAYGAGIYLAPDSGTSMGYAKTGSAWSKSRFGNSSSMKCMAIVEVIKAPGVPVTPNPYFVVKQEEWVQTRFFCFFPSNTSLNVRAANLPLDKYV
eukprot:TRINITY_DN5188_c0_g2_i1.p1 TRINITY_DN5188_c0_g2~~TRINITY_DN5188_c0_g2_i1.p1  ORF type:complete len:290 (+),score=24.78 TRINITY_DN5188_c0_g2_i1:330-1199(+)